MVAPAAAGCKRLLGRIVLAPGFLEFRRELHQATDRLKSVPLELQYHERLQRLVLIIQAVVLGPGKPETRVVIDVTENHDDVVPHLLACYQTIANEL